MFLAVLASDGKQLNALRPSEAAVWLWKCKNFGLDEGAVQILQRALIPQGEGGSGGVLFYLFILAILTHQTPHVDSRLV